MALKTNLNLPFLRQYDKLIAVAVLIVLLISLFYLTNAGATRKQEESNYDSQINELKPSGGTMEAMDLSAYEAAARLARSPVQLDVPQSQQAGFLNPERRVFCVNSSCRKPIPYESEICPFCEAKQPAAKPNTDGLDTDKDGIPDKVENALGLNPQDPSDAKGDLDSDGFSNLEEYLAKFDPKDPKSHPALVNLLRVKELRGKKLPIIFSGVNKMPDGKLQLVFILLGQNRRTFYVREGCRIGETNSVTGKADTDYVAGKVDVKFEERDNPNTPGIKKRVDVSTVVIKRLSDNKEMTLGINEVGKNTDVEAVIVLPLDSSEYTVLENGIFKVRDETYRVVSVDNAGTTVMIENQATGEQKVVRKLD